MSLQSLLIEQGHLAPPDRKNAANDGRSFQKELETTAGAYQAKRQCVLRKVDPPVRVIWVPDKLTGKSIQRVIFQQNPHLDYVGSYTAKGGRMLAIEAKSTSNHLLRFNADVGFKSSQWAAMKSWHWSGAITFMLWQYAGKVCLWTPDMLISTEASGAKSLRHEEGLKVERGMGTIIWDFLATLERVENDLTRKRAVSIVTPETL